ncbi:MAG: GTP cyclohydrolase I FolE [Phenylobacterium sp.]|uniref:GTP cyclohydrolase I n=1 Tax=Phenylobacterium sp. TaxID=1871053 RepID=UPI0025EC3676|nr:GTP cyclohydrolase I [Phenylobacterium sp.]MBI1197896.1 GTP cyclohydrolase I FolE [Phenylobacterium sp.]
MFEQTEQALAPSELPITRQASRREAEEAVRVLIRWAGDDPNREGLRATPGRVARAYEEWFSGYRQDPIALLDRTFSEIGSYGGLVVLSDIPVVSWCEHHMASIRGVAHVAYLPRDRVVGLSKLARLVETLGRRLQVQERLTAEIADALQAGLAPLGVGVVIRATHDCMSSRGVNRIGVATVTRNFTGALEHEPHRSEFLHRSGL